MFDTRRITMPCWSRLGRPKCSLPSVDASVMRLRGNLAWTKSKELCSWVNSTIPYQQWPFYQHHSTKKRRNSSAILWKHFNLIINTTQARTEQHRNIKYRKGENLKKPVSILIIYQWCMLRSPFWITLCSISSFYFTANNWGALVQHPSGAWL